MMRLLSCAFVLCWASYLLANYGLTSYGAEVEIDRAKLSECQVHVVGQYMPANSSIDCRVKVDVKSTGKPMVVVLCSYMETEWNVNIAKDADVRLILISGWFAQSAVIKPDTTPVKTIIGSGGSNSGDYFYAFSKFSASGHRVQEKLKALLGKEIDTFQGVYEGREFVIDGIRNQADPQAVSTTVAATEDARHTQWSDKVSSMVGNGADRESVENVVRKLFDLETKEKQQRIDQAEADLQKIKEKFAKRLAAAEEIIHSRVEAFVKDGKESAQDPPKSESPASMSSRAWELWNQHKFKEARQILERVVEQDPKNDEAWNRLGWSAFPDGDTDRAMAAFNESLKLNPQNLGSLNGRGRVFLAKGKLDEAEKDLLSGTEAVIARMGERAVVENKVTASWIGLVEVNIQQKDWPTALQWAERYLKYAPDDPTMKSLIERARNK